LEKVYETLSLIVNFGTARRIILFGLFLSLFFLPAFYAESYVYSDCTMHGCNNDSHCTLCETVDYCSYSAANLKGDELWKSPEAGFCWPFDPPPTEPDQALGWCGDLPIKIRECGLSGAPYSCDSNNNLFETKRYCQDFSCGAYIDGSHTCADGCVPITIGSWSKEARACEQQGFFGVNCFCKAGCKEEKQLKQNCGQLTGACVTGTTKLRITSPKCNAGSGVCDPGGTETDCGLPSAVSPFQYGCGMTASHNPSEVDQLFNDNGCTGGSCEGAVVTDPATNTQSCNWGAGVTPPEYAGSCYAVTNPTTPGQTDCQGQNLCYCPAHCGLGKSWKPVRTCIENTPIGNTRCLNNAVEIEVNSGVCDISSGNCSSGIGTEACCGRKWIRSTTQGNNGDCGGCKTSPAICAGDRITTLKTCGDCVVDNEGNAACKNTTETVLVAGCGPPQETSYDLCTVTGAKCRFTAKLPGTCFTLNGVPDCNSPTVEMTCNGYCDGRCAPGTVQDCSGGGTQSCDANGYWGDCTGGCTSGSTASCGNGGTQTCVNGQWGPCITPCADGDTQACAGGGTQTCSGGEWGPCSGDCDSGATQACGNGGTQTCSNGEWGPCVEPCSPAGATQACGNGGTQTCGPNGWSDCVEPCSSGSVQPCPSGGSQTCVNGEWGDCTGGCESGATQACAGGGVQTCDANGNWSDCPPTDCPTGQSSPHSVCSGNSCVSMSGCGVSADCSTCGDCPTGQSNPHSACQNGACVSVNSCGVSNCSNCGCADGDTQACPGGGFQTCSGGNWSNCSIYHNVCSGESCVSVEGAGESSCSGDTSCVIPKHNVCNGQACQSVDGAGSDACSGSADCESSHSECSGEVCISVTGVGINQCTSDDGCKIPKHNICNGEKQCVLVEGAGDDGCLSSDDCSQKHTECSAESCVEVDGPGNNQCSINKDCEKPKHNICNAQKQCVTVEGSGTDACQSDDGCQENHNECSLEQCVSVVGVGVNQCSTADDCKIPKHNICNEKKQCVLVDGEAPDGCKGDSDCNKTHTECVEVKCITVDGPGPDECTITEGEGECSTSSQCAAGYYKYNICDSNDKCVVRQASSWTVHPVYFTECQTDVDCTSAFHYECALPYAGATSRVCTKKEGIGVNQCSGAGDSTCAIGKHNVCQYDKCVVATGVGANECSTDLECPQYNTCVSGGSQKVCLLMRGSSGLDSCNSNADCQNYTYRYCGNSFCYFGYGRAVDRCGVGACPSHTACSSDGKCAVVSGECPDECNANIDCTKTYTKCIGGSTSPQCITVMGVGVNQCSSQADCPSHNKCEDDGCGSFKCVPAPGLGTDACLNDTDCGKNFTGDCITKHAECDGNKCIDVEGEGISQCSNDSDCPKHTECNSSNQCVLVTGESAFGNECQSAYDCPKHAECAGQQCVLIDGSGSDECSSDNDCADKPPYVEYKSPVAQYCTIVPGMGVVFFKWVYRDDAGSNETQFTLQIADNPSFSSENLIVNLTTNVSNPQWNPDGTVNEQQIYVKRDTASAGSNYISFNTTYYWRVLVTAESGAQSDPNNTPSQTYIYPYSHPAPAISYSTSPVSLSSKGGAVAFLNKGTTCYNDDGVCPCSDYKWSWDFGDGTTSNQTIFPIYTYGKITGSIINTSLSIQDDNKDKLWCSWGAPISVTSNTNSGPKWWEISPF